MLSKMKQTIVAAFTGINKYFTTCMLLGVAVMYYDQELSGAFGATISHTAEGGARAISIGSGTVLVIAAYHYFKGFKPLGYALTAGWVVLFSFNVFSNMGVATSDRQENILNADFATDTRSDKIKTRDDLAAKLKMFEQTQAKLEAQMLKLSEKKINKGWTVSIAPGQSPESFDGMIAAKQLEKDNEAKRGGCKTKCEARTRELAHLQTLRALAVSFAKNKEQHAATLRVLDKTRKELAETPPGHSTVKAQSSLHALIGDGRLSGDVSKHGVQAANNFTGIFFAFAFAIASVLLTLAGAWNLIMAAPAINLTAPAPSPIPRTSRPTASEMAQRFASRAPGIERTPAPTPSPTVIRERPGFDVRALIDRMQAAGA